MLPTTLTHNLNGSPNLSKAHTLNVIENNVRRNVSGDNDASLKLTRLVVPDLLAHELVGVQPMAGPVDIVRSIRVHSVPPSYVTDTRLGVAIFDQSVSSKTRRLASRWGNTTPNESHSQQDIDIAAEIMSALARGITAELDQELLSSLRRLAGVPPVTFGPDMSDGTPTFVGDVAAALAVMINRQANVIAARTRRGSGNWAVVSPTAHTILQSATTTSFRGVVSNTKFVGTLNESISVYVDPYAADSTPVLVGYKGPDVLTDQKDGTVLMHSDAAAILSPYIPVSAAGMVDGSMILDTRYGYTELTTDETCISEASDYIGGVGIDIGKMSFS
jgi:hypothetical protein